MSAPHESAPQEAPYPSPSQNNIIVMENNIISYDPSYGESVKISSKSAGPDKRIPQKMKQVVQKAQHSSAGMIKTVQSPIYSTSMQKISMPRSVQVVTKTVSSANNMIVCSPASLRPASNLHQPTIQHFIETPSQSPVPQQYESNTTTQYVPAAGAVKTIYMNNNNNSKQPTKVNLSPIDYSGGESVAKYQKANSPADVDSKFGSFKFTAVSSPSSSSSQACNSNINSSKTKNFINSNSNCNIKGVQQPQQQTYYYQPQPIQYAKGPTATKVGPQQQQFVQVQQQRLPANNFVQVGGKIGSRNPGKYIIQQSGGDLINQQIRYNTKNEVLGLNDVISINNSQASVIQSPIKMHHHRTVVHQIEPGSVDENCTRIYTVTETAPDEPDSSAGGFENYMIVNGTKMTDEMSAQILHDFSRGGSSAGNQGSAATATKYQMAATGDVIQIAHSSSPHIFTRQQSAGGSGTSDGIIWNNSQQQQHGASGTEVQRRSTEYHQVYQQQPSEFNCEQQSGQERIIYQQHIVQGDRKNSSYDLVHHPEQEDDIGVEIRPAPPPLTADGKLNSLHVVLQDHTYCSPIHRIDASTAFSTMNPHLESNTVAAAAVLSSMPGAAKFAQRNTVPSCGPQSSQFSCQQSQQGSHYDDDAFSTISNGSQDHPLRIDLQNDPGESTETANEGEDEDSETRCICDLTHDDGYMICCDNCSKWQHVDCMKIDRTNIPEEYLCVNCNPREVDRQAARTLQLQKRKEQSALLTYPLPSVYEGAQNKSPLKPITDKKNSLAKQRKNSTLGSSSKKSKDPVRSKSVKGKDSRTNGKRKDALKRLSKKKLKQQMEAGGNSLTITTPDKMAVALRSWIENYESAMTNHYSPELRARLHALYKHGTETPTDIRLMNDMTPCTTVPHAGAKILISTCNIEPNATIIEIRGKYMLASQHKPIQAPTGIMRKPASGPFLFFYSIHSKMGGVLELCVDTRTYGNEGRFVRRSCRPNAELLHSIEKNVIHLYIVARVRIMESTEITIAHDQSVDPATQTHSMLHTSTACACGLVTGCKFAPSPHGTLTPPILQGIVTKTRKNGSHGPEKEKRKYRKRNKDGLTKEKIPKENARGRGRSTSSSESTGLMSPPLKNHYESDVPRMLPPPQIMLPPETIAVNEFQVSSQAPLPPQEFFSNTTPSNHNFHHIEAPPLHMQYSQHPIDMILAQHMMSSAKSPPIKEPSPAVIEVIPPPLSPQRAMTPIQQQHTLLQSPLVSPPLSSPQPTAGIISSLPVTPQKEVLVSPVPVALPASTVIASAGKAVQDLIKIMPKSPPTTPQKNSRRTSKSSQRQNSLSLDPGMTPNDELVASVPTTPLPKDDEGKGDKESSTEKRKLTREERKMEAYMKAFEKLEKTQQRKQEQKSAKASPKKPRNPVLQKANLVNAQKRKMISQKRKKRKSKTIHPPSNTRKNDRHSGESDVATSSEETISKPGNSVNMVSSSSSFGSPSYKLSQAELLLSYSQFKNEPDTNLSGIPPLISPACMLIESAIGNLEQTASSGSVDNEFKFPKTKPKKSIMNEWLHQGTLKTEEPEYKVNFKPDINIVAAKVEEFLDRNIRYDEEPLSLVKNEYKPLTTPPQASSPQTESTCFGSESSLKKRWLRQAISEETADESSAVNAAEIATPLKKRRVYMEPEEESSNLESSLEGSQKEEVKEEMEDEVINETKNMEEDATVSSTVEENPLLVVSDVNVETTKPEIEAENTLVAEILKEEEPKSVTPKEEPSEVIDEDNKSSNSEEMAEYQKVIASFHNENIMILQTRNKKSKSFSSDSEKTTPVKLNFDLTVEENDTVSVRMKKRPSDGIQELLNATKVYKMRSPSPENTIESAPILAQTLTAPVTETIPFGGSRYLNNINRTSADEVPSILSAPPPCPEEVTASYSNFNYRPMMTNLTMNEYPDTSTTAGVVAPPPGTFLTSYNKATLITDPKAPIGSTLTGQFATVVNAAFPPPYIPTTPDPASSGSTTSPPFLGKSYSTLNDSGSYYGQKIFTKTSNSDPRLNPNLNPPELETKTSSQPKKKLSLTEYRKRKAQSTDSETPNDGSAACDNNNSTKSCEASPVKNNPSPTNSSDVLAPAESTTNQSSDEAGVSTEPTSISDSSDTLDMFDDVTAKHRQSSSTPEVTSSSTSQEPQSTTETPGSADSKGDAEE